MSLLIGPMVAQGTRDGRWSAAGEKDILALVDRVAELEAELARRSAAYGAERQTWADKKRAWARHEEMLKQRTFALRAALQLAQQAWCRVTCPAGDVHEALCDDLQHALSEASRGPVATTSPAAAPTPGGKT